MKRLTETASAALLNADPLWYKDAVIYQLHIKSFFDANGDGVGDFAGLLAKLDYLVNLGVDTIWLLPFYPSPRRDDGYDIADYRNVHPDYGTLAEARRFVTAAHARGLRVITELVINHTSDQHPWFQRARKAKPGSAARRYYVWSDHDQSYAGTRIIFCDTEKSNWSWDPVAGAYFWHRFYSHQPDLNFDNPQVLNEVLSVMRFWLDMGIDGLRLDAVPYLVEREGTSNENLPETHAVIRSIRAHLDEHFRGRMLLAEANMWPEDAQQYFGLTGPEPEGDECHMCFHFPLMPRMYMAIAREDRFPITDIMRQTPEVPPNCQWAIFLRNHDELTLEMVTSSERDYLWEVYATDRRARINLGIRRRLAPLMERDRRRIELMNSLLFSMPGTPVIYYGDEIGMGDNIHLGDRDGVRTPMQWSPDRNGGFSHADPERLVLPPLQGPLYGYEAVNVEAQARDPHSLLNWMRRMLALRRKHRAFGRGTLRFLFPGNRKILAYLREYEGEHILCVANLSRAPQAVELDLSTFNGRVPVEMMGATPFPAIGTLTYLLTLPPYGFYWFVLSDEAQPPSWHVEAPEQMPDQITLVMQNIGRPELTDASRRALATEVLPHYISRRRWFGGKHERIERVGMAYLLPFTRGSNGEDVYLGEVEVALPGRTERYQLPVGILWDRESPDGMSQLAHGLSMARVRQGSRVGLATDGFVVEPFAREVVQALRKGVELQAGPDRIRFRAEPGLAALELERDPIEWMSAEQSNSSLSYNSTAVLKLVRRLSGGIHPEAEMTRYLTAQGYAHAAPLLGEVVRTGADGVPHTLMLLQGYILNQGNGWDWTLDYLGRAIDDALPAKESEDEFAEAMNGYAAMAGTLGRRLAELHAVLSRPTDDEAFAPVPATESDARDWAAQALQALERALATVDQRADSVQGSVPQTFDADVQTLMAARGELPALVEQLARAAPGSLQTRFHGDFHLGQVLIAQSDTYLVDFEGEPGRTLDWRRRKTSPLRDVAGLLRSLDYAAATVGTDRQERTHTELPPQLAERRALLLERFRSTANEAFLQCYRQHMEASPAPWVDPAQLQPLLDLFLLERAAYEVDYEAANRVAWIDLPVSGLARLLRKLLGQPGAQP
ncbi:MULTISPECIES: maltose alpha-D-glucosyltransferase [Cupriavidus]|uniref:maltose alpha-D-glucosyltransferase n=1 Tax=Cupriavidus oxalaticus TaxID=96344 RepID=A0A4V1BXZ1_9BURK|nr:MULTISPECIES: maltose alpha-D-glucosyltransferase [Cupriavidus]MBF6987901.1 maltose alpha-D-glucosyltransferase [Cupriavidus sp. IK-TO18]QBY50002.1 maltose alpha-D-glucosyltransferase [Cupriavidus oxalaticus]